MHIPALTGICALSPAVKTATTKILQEMRRALKRTGTRARMLTAIGRSKFIVIRMAELV